MKNWGNHVATLAISIAVLCAAAIAGPATKPTTKPAGKPSDSKKTAATDNTIYKCDSLGFQFQFPKSYKLDSRNSSPTRFRFDLKESNSQGAHSSKEAFTTEDISITGGQPCHGEATLDTQVANMRDRKDDKGNTPKILKDEGATLGGVPARRFTIEVVTRWTETGPGTGPKILDVKTRQEHVVAVKDGLLYDLCLDCDPNTFNQRSKLFGRAIDSFEWIEKPAPADQKK